MKNSIIILLLLVCNSKIITYAQSNEFIKDSLEIVIDDPSFSDSLKSDAYLQLFRNHCYSLNDSCDYLSNAISIAEESSNELLLHTYSQAGNIHNDKGNYQVATSYYNQGLRAIRDSTNYDQYSGFYGQLGYSYSLLENADMVSYFYDESIKSAKLAKLGDYGIGWKYNSFGEVFFQMGEYINAIDYWKLGAESFQKHLKYDREGSYYGMNNSYVNIAMTYGKLQLWDLSTIYMTKCVTIQDSIDNAYSKSWTRYVLASFYEKMGEIEKSEISLIESLKNTDLILSDFIGKPRNSHTDELKRIKFIVLTSLANNYGSEKRFEKADSVMNLLVEMLEGSYSYSGITETYQFYQTQVNLDFLKGDSAKALNTCKEIIDDKNLSIDKYFYVIQYSKYLLSKKQYNEVTKILNEYLASNKDESTDFDLESLYILLSKAYAGVGDFEKAYKFEQEYKIIQDSIRSDERDVRMIKTAIEFDYSHQILQDSLLLATEKTLHEKNLKAEQEKTESQEKLNTLLIFGLGLVFLLGLWALRNALLNKRANKLIQKQKEHAEAQKVVVEDKNKEIIDSINYAKRIQSALLSSENNTLKNLPPHFICYQPKDIVSGDFYWLLEKGDYMYIAVADCTGHGVPGGFMSMLGISFLNEINAKQKILTPAEILNQLREKIIKELSQKNDDIASKDGMDISLLRIEKLTNWNKNSDTIDIMWAGANNTLFIANKKELKEVKGDRQPIGMHAQMTDFTNFEISVEKGNMLYLFSDGYPDQFGGPKHKKFKVNQLKKLIKSFSEKPVTQQKEELFDNFTSWKGNLEQTDDICVFGIKI